MAIDLIPVGSPIPAQTVPDISEVPEIAPKKGRGRPPGAKNKVKIPIAPIAPVVPVVPVVPAAPAVIETPPVSPPEPPPTEPSEESETETETESEPESPPPPPRPKRRPRELAVAKAKPKTRPKRVPIVREDTPSPPETPRAAKRRLYGEHRERQTQAINLRKERFAVLLDRFMR